MRSQLAIFFSAFLIGLLLRRGGGFSGHPLQYVTGFWLLMSTLKLHGIAAPFTRERLLGLGLPSWLRRVLAACVVAAIAAACWWSMRDAVHYYARAGEGHRPVAAMVRGHRRQRAVVVAAGAVPLGGGADVRHRYRGFPARLAGGAGDIILHYAWALRAQVSFEDASIVHARKRAERTAAMREGRMGGVPSKPRAEPFRLAGAGGHSWPPSCGRTWSRWGRCTDCALAARLRGGDRVVPVARRRSGAQGGIGGNRHRRSCAFGAWLVFFGPMLMQNGFCGARSSAWTDQRRCRYAAESSRWANWRRLRRVLCFAFWWLLLFGAQAIAARHSVLTTMQIVAAAVALALVAPPLSALMLCAAVRGHAAVPRVDRRAGIVRARHRVMGQRMVFMLGYLFTVLLAAIPAALLGGIGFLLGQWLGSMAVAMLAAALGACAVFAFELAPKALRLLGRRIDRFDLSQELR